MMFGAGDMLALSLSGDQKAQPYLQTPSFEGSGRFSPDGRWVAYDSNDSGNFEVFLQGFPERRGKWQVSANHGIRPEWRADGKELYWVSQGVPTAASVELLPAGVRVGRPVPLFPVESGWYQAAGDGRKFLVLEPEENQPADPPMTVIVNWPTLLKKGVAGE
jgi:eukaryotic-like serine/threonine-protein kinase